MEYNELIRKVANIIEEFSDLPETTIAEKIVTEVFQQEIRNIKDQYERLFYTDTSNEN